MSSRQAGKGGHKISIGVLTGRNHILISLFIGAGRESERAPRCLPNSLNGMIRREPVNSFVLSVKTMPDRPRGGAGRSQSWFFGGAKRFLAPQKNRS